jgi:hypothetical protein
MRADMSQNYVKDSTGESPVLLTYSYTDSSVGEHTTRTLQYENTTRWDDILEDFIGFLSCVYGYNIREKIQIEGNFWDKFEEGREFY